MSAHVLAVQRMIGEAGQLQHMVREQGDMIERFPVRPRVDNPVIEQTTPLLTPAEIHQARFAMWKRCKTVRRTAVSAATAAAAHAEASARRARRVSERAVHKRRQNASGEATKADMRELMRSSQRSAKLMSAETRVISAALRAPSSPARKAHAPSHEDFQILADDTHSSVKIGDGRWGRGGSAVSAAKVNGGGLAHRAGLDSKLRNFRAETRGVERVEVRDRYASIDDPRRCGDCMPGGLARGVYSTVGQGARVGNHLYGART